MKTAKFEIRRICFYLCNFHVKKREVVFLIYKSHSKLRSFFLWAVYLWIISVLLVLCSLWRNMCICWCFWPSRISDVRHPLAANIYLCITPCSYNCTWGLRCAQIGARTCDAYLHPLILPDRIFIKKRNLFTVVFHEPATTTKNYDRSRK